MKICVLGGSGYIGKNLIYDLLESGHYVKCITRSNISFKHINLEILNINDISESNICEFFDESFQVIINCIGEKKDQNRMEDLNVSFVQGIVDQLIINCKKCTQHLIHLSSIGVYKKKNSYEQTKLRAENLIISAAIESGFSYTIIQPSNVMGFKKSSNFIKYINYCLFIRIAVFFGSKKNIYPFIHIKDLSKIICGVIDNKIFINKKVIASNQCTVESLIFSLSENLGIKYYEILIPKFVAVFFIKTFDSYGKNFHKLSTGISALLSNIDYLNFKFSDVEVIKSDMDIVACIRDEY